MLLLAERGELSLDDPLTRFFPGFAKAARGVKVRHLLGHTSGLLDYEELIPPGTTVPLKDKDVLDLVGKQDRLYFAPGSQFRYALLALIVEKVSGGSSRSSSRRTSSTRWGWPAPTPTPGLC